MCDVALNLPHYFFLLLEKPFGPYCEFKLELPPITCRKITRKQIFLYLEGTGHVQESLKNVSISTNHSFHQRSSP